MSGQKAAHRPVYQSHHFADRKPSTERRWGVGVGVIYPGDLQRMPPPTLPLELSLSSSLQTWYSWCLHCNFFFTPRGPCFDRESTSYQFPNLTDSLGASSNAIFCRKRALGLLHPTIAPSSSPQPSTWPKYSPPLHQGDRCTYLWNICLLRLTRQLLLGQEYINFFHTVQLPRAMPAAFRSQCMSQ